MEDLACLWSYQEDIEELKQKLLYTTIELESVRLEASEEVRRNKENIKQLHQLLKVASQERDEAKDQLHKLLNNSFIISPSNPITEFTPILPQTLTRAHLINPAKKSNSRSITESTNIAYVNQPFQYILNSQDQQSLCLILLTTS